MSQAVGPVAYGTDAAGANAYTTLIAKPVGHYHKNVVITLGGTSGTNDAIVSFDGGVTDHLFVPGGTTLPLLPNVLITGAIQGKNFTTDSNYAGLHITIW